MLDAIMLKRDLHACFKYFYESPKHHFSKRRATEERNAQGERVYGDPACCDYMLRLQRAL